MNLKYWILLTIIAFLQFEKAYGQHMDSCDKIQLTKIQDIKNASLLSQFQVKDYNYFFVSEVHSISINRIVRLQLIKELVNKCNVNNIVLEAPPSFAILLNKFLENNDNNLIANIDSSTNNNIIKQLKIFNDSLPQEKKIKFWGIDFEIDNGREMVYIQVIQLLFSNTRYISDINNIINSGKKNTQIAYQLNDFINTAFQNDSLKIKEVLSPKDYLDFTFLNTTIKKLKVPHRDMEMYNMLQMELPYFTKTKSNVTKFFMQFGANHLITSMYKNNFYSLFTKSKITENKSFLIGLDYTECISTYDDKKINIINDGGFELDENAKQIIVAMSKNESSLYLKIPNCNEFEKTKCNVILCAYKF